jgi:hypothetical protein
MNIAGGATILTGAAIFIAGAAMNIAGEFTGQSGSCRNEGETDGRKLSVAK